MFFFGSDNGISNCACKAAHPLFQISWQVPSLSKLITEEYNRGSCSNGKTGKFGEEAKRHGLYRIVLDRIN
jgi:hypothetical protein